MDKNCPRATHTTMALCPNNRLAPILGGMAGSVLASSVLGASRAEGVVLAFMVPTASMVGSGVLDAAGMNNVRIGAMQKDPRSMAILVAANTMSLMALTRGANISMRFGGDPNNQVRTFFNLSLVVLAHDSAKVAAMGLM